MRRVTTDQDPATSVILQSLVQVYGRRKIRRNKNPSASYAGVILRQTYLDAEDAFSTVYVACTMVRSQI